jgi:hypothetical protein
LEYVAPVAVFLFFFALIVRQAGRSGEGLRERIGTWRAGRREPPALPARGAGAERFVRYGAYAAWLLGLVGLVMAEADDRFLALLLPSGLLLIAIGVVLATNRDDVNARIRAREERSLGYAIMRRRGRAHGLVGVGAVFIGGCWAAVGGAAIVGAIA